MNHSFVSDPRQHSWTVEGKDLDQFVKEYQNPTDGLCNGVLIDKTFDAESLSVNVSNCLKPAIYAGRNDSKLYCKRCAFNNIRSVFG